MATWPAIPAWLMGVSINVGPVLRSSTSGYASQRRAFDRRNDIMDATLSLTAAEFATFETFVQTTLNQGSDQFTGPYYDGAGYQTGTVQLVGGNYSPVWNGSHFDVSAQLQVFNRRDPDLALMAYLHDLGHPVALFERMLASLEIAVNDNNL